MKTTELIVTKCKGCPFSELDENNGYLSSDANCLAPVEVHENYDISSYYKKNTSPNWCPLKKTNLLITFKY